MTQARCPPFTDGPASCVATPTPKVHQARIRRIARRGSLGSIARTHSVGASPFAPMARPLWFAFETRLAGQGGGSHRRLGDVQVIDEGLGPGLAVVLGHRQKLALVVGVAQRMGYGWNVQYGGQPSWTATPANVGRMPWTLMASTPRRAWTM